MGVLQLEIRCPRKVNGIVADPEPDWSFNELLSELNSLENKLNASSQVPVPFIKAQSREFSGRKNVASSSSAFVMRVSDDEIEDEEDLGHRMVVAKRFNCNDIYLSESEDSDYELSLDDLSYKMDKMGSVDGALFELSQEHQVGVKEDIRNQISTLEMELRQETEKSDSAFRQVENYREARKESERKFDTQYQRNIAETLDNYITGLQRDRELKSQIEERRIRNDAAHEEAKRKEKALQEESLRQERARVEAEVFFYYKWERRAAKESAEREEAEASKSIAALASQGGVGGLQKNNSSVNQNLQYVSDGRRKFKSPGGVTVRASESALHQEQGRLQKLKKLDEEKQLLKSSSSVAR